MPGAATPRQSTSRDWALATAVTVGVVSQPCPAHPPASGCPYQQSRINPLAADPGSSSAAEEPKYWVAAAAPERLKQIC